MKVMTDAFGFARRSGQHDRFSELKLSMRAGLVLREEHPISAHLMEPMSGNSGFHLTLPVADYREAKRFVQGCRDEVDVLGDAGFLSLMLP
jgi:hypothetical protein